MDTITLNQSLTTKSDPDKLVAIYCRISTNHQTVQNQLLDLQKVATRNNWEVVGVYTDEGISGKHGRDKRPQFDELMKDATRRKFDLIMSWDVSRLGRSLKHLVEFMEDIQSKNIDLYLHANGLDSSTPSGRAMFDYYSDYWNDRDRPKQLYDNMCWLSDVVKKLFWLSCLDMTYVRETDTPRPLPLEEVSYHAKGELLVDPDIKDD